MFYPHICAQHFSSLLQSACALCGINYMSFLWELCAQSCPTFVALCVAMRYVCVCIFNLAGACHSIYLSLSHSLSVYVSSHPMFGARPREFRFLSDGVRRRCADICWHIRRNPKRALRTGFLRNAHCLAHELPPATRIVYAFYTHSQNKAERLADVLT